MSVVAPTIDGMAKNKSKSGPAAAPEPERKPQVAISLRMSKQLAEALDAYVHSLRPEPFTTSVLKTALEDFLAAKGFWPPAD